MITIDRSAASPVHEQLVEQLRYQIASGQYAVDHTLPSTRALARQLDVSFHTVRKAYQALEQEGLLEARVGSGYRVKARAPLGKAERMERGATFAQEALQRMIGLGLGEAEIEYLMQEQLSLLEGTGPALKLLFAASYRELAVHCAGQLTEAIQQPVEPVSLSRLGHHQDADYVFTHPKHLRTVMQQIPHADVLAVATYLPSSLLEQVARLHDHETLGLITRHPDAIGPLTQQLRQDTAFKGQILAITIEEGTRHLAPFLDQTDLIAYTPLCRRKLLTHLKDTHRHAALAPQLTPDALQAVQQAVPT